LGRNWRLRILLRHDGMYGLRSAACGSIGGSAEQSFRWGIHRGVAHFGLIKILGCPPELVEGIDRSFEAIEKCRGE
jgi:hypothetical protein